MNIELFTLHLGDFLRRHNLPVDVPARIAKLREEIAEWGEAVESGDKARIMEETTDILITGFALMMAYGVTNVLWPMFLKLQRTAERAEYRRMRVED